MEKQGEVCKAIGPLAGARRVGLRHTGLQAQVLDFRMVPRRVAAREPDGGRQPEGVGVPFDV